MSVDVREFEYKEKWTSILLTGGAALVMTPYFLYEALANYRGLVINGIIRLSPTGATIFYWIFTLIFFSLLCYSLFSIYQRTKLDRRIGLTPVSIILPGTSWTSEHVNVPFSEIQKLESVEAQGQEALKIIHSKGKFPLRANLLPRPEDFVTICEAIFAGIEANAKAEEEIDTPVS